MKKRSKKHHYVPRFLLEEFALNRTHIWGYNKVNEKKFSVNIADAGSENHFNSLSDDLCLEGMEKDSAELALADIDDRCSRILRGLLAKLRTSKLLSPNGFPKFLLSAELVSELSWFAIIQTVRTKEFRESLHQMDLLTHKMAVEFYKGTEEGERLWDDKPPELDKLNIQMTKGADKIRHFQLMFDAEFLNRMRQMSLQKIWMIGVNATKVPLCIGDNPVVTRSHTNGTAAWGSLGVEVAFPICPEFILIWVCPSLLKRNNFGYSVADEHDGRTIELTENQVEYYNSLAYLRSTQFIYQSTEDFSLFEKMAKQAHPDSRNPFRPRASMDAFGKTSLVTSDYRTKGIPIE